MLFYSFFKTLVDKEVIVELKNDIALRGTLHSVDQYLNIKLSSVEVTESDKYPYLGCMKNCFVRGSAVRYIQLPAQDIDVDILHDATRKDQLAANKAK